MVMYECFFISCFPMAMTKYLAQASYRDEFSVLDHGCKEFSPHSWLPRFVAHSKTKHHGREGMCQNLSTGGGQETEGRRQGLFKGKPDLACFLKVGSDS